MQINHKTVKEDANGMLTNGEKMEIEKGMTMLDTISDEGYNGEWTQYHEQR